MKSVCEQTELFGLVLQRRDPFKLRVNDVIRLDGNRLGRVIRVNECSALVLVRRQAREFTTRFDKRVCFQPPPTAFHISANAQIEILNRKTRKKQKQRNRKENI